MVLIYPSVTANVKLNEWVSVPLRGLWFLSGWNADVFILDMEFPSPYGDYGSYLSRMKKIRDLTEYVSVPLRGLWFLSSCYYY